VQKYYIEKNDLKPICDDIDLGAQNCLLFERSRIKTVDKIAQPMNEKSNQAIAETLLQNCQDEKQERSNQSNERKKIGLAVEVLRR